ncbi:uncharacterized protein LY89DRAFT_789653 [Mollisia scopiformis]|uniref:DUF676 domain-containing protein n=1 Tax=Mollisia scopiformis TaxID=149040 RepID=A0A132B593_MOLSC|nr:uncharacterized protein LY89DRAFT_789653 [Mollisia scopiformis]KUJ07580.1 hypothetical protein LY89DRAFT_789653 [Mollisia scopiformis]
MAIKTLLLCFIHGFKGDEETFYQFPEDLKAAVTSSNPDIAIETRVYPKYETRGDLALSVETFKEWLQSQVITLETSSTPPNPSAIHSPSVAVILVAHSMGGFVAADTLFSILDNRPVSQDPNVKLMFPLIQGVLAFDTPYNGLSRSMFAYGAFSQYQNISQAWNLLSTGTSFLSSAGAKSAASNVASNQLAARGAESKNSWTRWSALAARTGTYGAIMAGGVAAYIHRDQILQGLRGINRENLAKINYSNTRDAVTSINYSDSISQGLTYVSRESIGEGFAWMASHLKFVGALMKTTQLTTRLERLSEIEGVGVRCLYTSLGENGVWSGGYFVPKRTFCAVPTAAEKEKGDKMKELFIECPDTKAKDEIMAHCGMFKKDRNENYGNMLDMTSQLVKEWMQTDPQKVKDEWRPSGDQLKRTMSESKVWDDDGKVLQPPGGEGDVGQLDAILKSDEMPQGEDGGVDEKELMERAAGVPLPVEEDVVGEGVLGSKSEEAESTGKDAEEKQVGGSSQEKEEAVEKKEVNEAPAEEKTSDEEQPPMTEYEKPMKVENNHLAEEMDKTTLKDKPQVTETQEPQTGTTAEDPKQQEASSAPKGTWMGMIPGMSSSATKDAEPETKTEQQEQPTAEKDAAAQKGWMGYIPSVPSFSAKGQETANKEEGQKDDTTEQPAGEPRKKWFGVV